MDDSSDLLAKTAQPASPGRSGRTRSRFLSDSVLVVMGVVLGFAVTQWRESVVERRLAARVLDDVVLEVQANLQQIDAQMGKHQQALQGLLAALPEVDGAPAEQSGLDFVFSRVGADFGPRPLRQAAWDAAVSTGALRLLDYEVAAMLSDIYVSQEKSYDPMMTQTTQIVLAPEVFDPMRRKEIVVMIRWLMEETLGHEKYVKEKYEEYLPRLREAAALK